MHGKLVTVKERVEQAHLAASMHYLQGQTMESIARTMGVSRSTVSRLLTHAREAGLVRISVVPPSDVHDSVRRGLSNRFSVRPWIVPVRPADPDLIRLRDVAQVAATRVGDLMDTGSTLGIAWGNTTSAITPYLPTKRLSGTTVVQLNGASNASDSGIPYADEIISQAAEAFGARMVHFPVPAFFDYADTKAAMWRERSVISVLNTIRSCDIALFGVGAMSAKLPSHVYASGFLDKAEIDAAKADGVVGDVCTVLLRENGSTNMALNARASGPSPAQLRRIPVRVCVAAGDSKVLPLLAALRAGVATDLVVDSSLARKVLDAA